MDVILPVAGLGSRLRPQTWSKPKPLVSIAGKPILAHVLDRVLPMNPDKLIFVTGYLGDQIEEWARSTYDIPMVFIEQPEMRGQTDAIIRARHEAQDEALILFPDMLFETDFTVTRASRADAIMFTKEVEDPSALGIAVLDETGAITKLVEKPKDPVSRLAVIGIYWFRQMGDLYAAIEKQMERGISLKGEYFIADAVQLMIDEGKRVETAMVTEWEDCGNDEALLGTNRWLLDRGQACDPREGSVIIQPSVIDPTAIIEHSVVGPHVSVGAGATIRGAVVRDAIIEDGALVEGGVLEHSIVGRRAAVRSTPTQINVGDNSAVRI